MPIQTIQLSDLITQIKTEARVKGATNLDLFITNLINELLLQESINHRYHEFLTLNDASVVIADGSGGPYNLPTGFFEIRTVRYKFANGYSKQLSSRNSFVNYFERGTPKFFEVFGTEQIGFFPFTDVSASGGDSLILDYYTYPPQLVNPTDVFPIPKFLGPLKQLAAARVHIYNKDFNAAQALKGEAVLDTERAQTGD